MKKQSNEFYHRVVEEALTGILVFSNTSKSCVFANPLAINLLEWPEPEKLSSRKFADLTPEKPDKRITCFTEELLNNEGFYQEVLLQKANGLYLVSNLGVKHFTDAGEEYVLLMIQDITIQKRLQRELTEKQTDLHKALADLKGQNRQLRELDLAKNRFIALTTHELRTPLAALVASAEVLQMGLYDSKDQLDEFIDLIVDQGRHLSKLVNDVLDFTKLQAGKMDYYIGLNNVAPLILNRIENFRSMAAGTGIKLEVSMPENIECYYDELRFQQVFDNILNNAIKYNVQDGTVRVYATTDEELVKIFIEDTGRGIAPEHLGLVFDEFETLGQVAQHHQGTGLGMPISKRMMESMGGRIQVKSELGKGSKFWIEVPKTQVLPLTSYRSRVQKNAA